MYVLTCINPSNTFCEHPVSSLQLTNGYSGSDIRLVCKEAAMHSVRKVFNELEKTAESANLENITFDPVRTRDVEVAIENTKPSAKLLVSKYVQWQKEYESV